MVLMHLNGLALGFMASSYNCEVMICSLVWFCKGPGEHPRLQSGYCFFLPVLLLQRGFKLVNIGQLAGAKV